MVGCFVPSLELFHKGFMASAVKAPLAFFQEPVKMLPRDAITAAQFLDVPATESNQTITLYEEDRIQGYFGGGYLYAMPERTEPML